MIRFDFIFFSFCFLHGFYFLHVLMKTCEVFFFFLDFFPIGTRDQGSSLKLSSFFSFKNLIFFIFDLETNISNTWKDIFLLWSLIWDQNRKILTCRFLLATDKFLVLCFLSYKFAFLPWIWKPINKLLYFYMFLHHFFFTDCPHLSIFEHGLWVVYYHLVLIDLSVLIWNQ